MKSPIPAFRCSALTLLELLIVVGLLVILALLGLPMASRAVDASRQVKCLNNLRQYGSAVVALISERRALPWWDGNPSASMAPGSTYPDFSDWLKDGGYLLQTPRCPNSTAKDRERTSGMNYGANSGLCIHYPGNPFSIPAPSARIVLAAECYGTHFNIPGHLNRTIWANNDGGASPETEGSAGLWPTPQFHGSRERRGSNLMFMDGHVELVFPVDNDWRKEPVYGASDNRGYVYDRDQLRRIKLGTLKLN